ncbi:MAG: hypothetical protein AAB316_07125, partial [Bacteroidota bacterium]
RKEEAVAKNDEALLEYDVVVDGLNKLGVHLYSIQLRNDGFVPTTKFAQQSVNFILENAKRDYNGFQKIAANSDVMKRIQEYNDSMSYNEPLMDYTEEQNELEGGRRPGSMSRPQENRHIPQETLVALIRQKVARSVEFTNKSKEILSVLINEGHPGDLNQIAAKVGIHDVGPYEEAFMWYILSIQQDKNLDAADALGEKFRLFAKVYFPLNIRGASWPVTSYVLFMPEKDVNDYKATIHRLSSLTSESSSDQKRQKIMEVYQKLVQEFTGNKGVEFQNLTSSGLRDILQGVYKLGLKMKDPLDHKLVDIEDKEKVSDEEVNKILARFQKVEEYLENIIREGSESEFCYFTDNENRYYWIPLEDAY